MGTIFVHLLVRSCYLYFWPHLPYPCGSWAVFDSSFPFVWPMWYKVLARLWSWHVPSWQPRWGARRGRSFTAMLWKTKRGKIEFRLIIQTQFQSRCWPVSILHPSLKTVLGYKVEKKAIPCTFWLTATFMLLRTCASVHLDLDVCLLNEMGWSSVSAHSAPVFPFSPPKPGQRLTCESIREKVFINTGILQNTIHITL